jgi:dTDP-4-amino-4,6-dideoxygalactose transaminase
MIDQEDIKAVVDVLASGKIAQGEKVKEFENALSRFIGTKYAVAVSSGTSALHLALNALGVGAKDEVIMPSYVCSSPYFAALHAGAVPKIVDVDFADLNICAATVKRQLSRRTKAIIVPHMFGTSAELDELLELRFPIVEDCAQSLGAEYKGRLVGGFGELSIFSFYATKMITTGEGGMVLTDNEEFYTKMIDIRDYDKKPLTPMKYNYKMTDFQAALGLSQLKKLQFFIERRRKIASLYTQQFSQYDVEVPRIYSHKKSVFYRYVVKVNKIKYVQKLARENGVMCERPIFKPLHKYLSHFKCPNSDRAYNRALSIPLYPGLLENEIKHVLQTIDLVFSKI